MTIDEVIHLLGVQKCPYNGTYCRDSEINYDCWKCVIKNFKSEIISECIDVLEKSIPETNSEDIKYGFDCAIQRLKLFKEVK